MVSYQPKEIMKLTGITVEEKAVVTAGATYGRAELAKTVNTW